MAVRHCIMIMRIVTQSHRSCCVITYHEGAMVEQMHQRGWPQDDIDTWFRDWRSDEENSEKEQLTHNTDALRGGTHPPPSIYGYTIYAIHICCLPD